MVWLIPFWAELEDPLAMATREKRTGGAWNLNGVHYQLLRSLFQAIRILESNVDSDEETPRESYLVLEPATGGDHRVEESHAVVIEQMKTRSARTWPLDEIVHVVLPDLYRAFRRWEPDRQVLKARFVTDGRRGRWKAIERFFRELPPCEDLPDPIWAGLDKEPLGGRPGKLARKLKERGLEFTRQGLFRYISQVLNESRESKPEDDRRVWRLLRTFEFEEVSEDSLRRAVLDWLPRRLARIEAAKAMLWQLLGHFLDRGRNSETIVPRDLLAEFGWARVDLGDRQALLHRGRRVLREFLANRRYQPDLDVRAHRWTERVERQQQRLDGEKPVTIIHGESGQGKSWALYARSLSVSGRGDLALVIEAQAADDRDAVCQRAASSFCDDIWDVDEPRSLERLAKRMRRVDPAAAQHWLTVFIDGVQDIGLARDLVAYDWARKGIRLLFSLTTTGRENLDRELSGCRLEKVEDFSARELSDFLKNHIGDLALRASYSESSLLRRPLMARLFCDLVHNASSSRPTSEFDLLADTWKLLIHRKPMVMSKFAAMVAELPDGRPYPWSLRMLHGKLMEEEVEFLTRRSGLLRMTSDGRSLEVWHDRLLNWALAEGWVQLLRNRELSVERLTDRMLSALFSTRPENRWGGRWFGRAVHDALWLMCEPAYGLSSSTVEIVAKLTSRLPRLDLTNFGPRIVPMLLELVRQNPRRAHFAIDTLQQMDNAGALEHAGQLLRDEDIDTRLAAARILQEQPAAHALDALWALRIEFEDEKPENPRAIVSVGRALAACARSADDWVRRKIRQADPATEPAYALAYLLLHLENGRQLWFELRDILFAKVSTAKERSLATCIESFRDDDYLEWLEARRDREDDFLGAAARRALFVLRRDYPPGPIATESWESLAWTRNWWLLPHLNAGSLEAEQLIVDKIEADEDPWKVARSLSGFESRIAPETLDLLLDATATRLSDEMRAPNDEDRDLLWGPASFLAEIRRLPLIKRFEARRGTEFEDNLTLWLCERGTRGRSWSLTGKRALRILRRIGGEGMTRLAHHFLHGSCGFHVLLDAIELAVMRPDERTAELLFDVAVREVIDGQGDAVFTSGTGPEIPFAQVKAITALVRIGRKDLALRGVMKWGLTLSWRDIDLFLAQSPQKEDTEPLRTALQRPEGQEPGAVFAVGLARWREQVPRIHAILRESSEGSELSRACLLALMLIGDRSPKTTRVFVENLDVPQSEKISWLALLDIQTPEAIQALKSRLRKLKESGLSSSDNAVLIAANLLDYEMPDVRREIAEYLWSEFDRNTILFVTSGELGPFADLEREDIDEWLCDLSFDESGNHLSYGGQPEVIRAFAKRDLDRAFDAALRLRNLGTLDPGAIPSLLLDVNSARALPVLREWVITGKSIPILAAIGEALHLADQIPTLIEWLSDSSPRLREGACVAAEVVSWTDELADVLRERLYDQNFDVRIAANRALNHLWHAREIEFLIDEILAETDSTRQWCLLEIVLEGAHPGLTANRRQPWMDRLFRHLPLAMWQFAADRFKARRDKLKNELKRRERSK